MNQTARPLLVFVVLWGGACATRGPSTGTPAGAGAAGSAAGAGGAAGATAGASGSSAGGPSAVAGGGGGAAAGGGGGAGIGGMTASCAPIAARDPMSFIHPGGLLKRSDMDRMRYLLAAGVEPWVTAYQKLRADSLASPTYAVRGDPTWTQVSRDAGVHAAEFESDAN